MTCRSMFDLMDVIAGNWVWTGLLPVIYISNKKVLFCYSIYFNEQALYICFPKSKRLIKKSIKSTVLSLERNEFILLTEFRMKTYL